MEKYFNSTEEKVIPVNLKLLLKKYLRLWYWFVLSIIVSSTGAYYYLRFTPPVYQVSAVILIKNQPKNTDENVLKGIEATQGNKVVENEIELLKSRSLMLHVVDDLNLTVGYFKPETMRSDVEIYGSSPIWVYYSKLTNEAYAKPIFIKIISKERFELHDEKGRIKGTYAFSQNIASDYGLFRVFFNDSLYHKGNDLVKVAFYNREEIAQHYKSIIKVDLLNTKSTVLKITLEDALLFKGKAILSKLIESYTYSALADKNQEATNTLHFIDERLHLITNELGNVEKDVETYKSAKGITDLSAEGNLFLSAVKSNDSKLNDVSIQLKVLNGVENYLKISQSGIAPATLSVIDPIQTQLLNKLNELYTQQEEFSRTMQTDNPFLQTVNAQIANTKSAILESVDNQKKNLQLTRVSLEEQNQYFESSIRTIPKKEREFVNIKRQQGIKESLYLLLLQKKEETAISYASTVTDSRVVDDPYGSLFPIKPNKANVYLLALLAGLLIPMGTLGVIGLMNDKVQTRNEIETETGLAVFGEIIRKPKNMQENYLDLKNNSVISEQFKILRANLQYAVGGTQFGDGQSILVTSSIGEEGKSFVSINLASSLALLDKKVVILELDLRKPKIASYLNIANGKRRGLSNYLIGQSEIIDIIKPVSINPNLFLISSGPIPPNPTELLSNGRIKLLLDMLRKQFDYIIVDTPPLTLVADATLLSNYVDVAFYIVRHNYTPKRYLKQLAAIKASNKFKSLNVIFNSIDYRISQEYGYGYSNDYSSNKV